MSLVFGDLANDFVIFTGLLNKADNGDIAAEDLIPAAAASFRHSASKSALWLALVGALSYLARVISLTVLP